MARQARPRGLARWAAPWAWLALLCLAAWPGAASASDALPTQTWNLALVVDCSQEMAAPWLGASRLAVLEPALQTELASLPLRARAGLWVVGGGPGQARALAAPRPAVEFKGYTLVLPRLGGTPDLAQGLAQAAAWLKEAGPGVLLVISGGQARLAGPAVASLPLGWADLYAHALALGPDQADQEQLAALALAGGGGLFVVGQTDQIGPLLHRAVALGLSPSRLLVLAHDTQNHVLNLTFGLERRDQLALGRQGRSGHPLQLLPGVYQLAWPPGHGLGPAPSPSSVSIPAMGEAKLWAGGTGHLAVKALDPQGQELPWMASVANLETGKVELSERRLPLAAQLPAGLYRVRTIRPPLAWTVEVGAGSQVHLVAGPPGRLEARLKGPLGPWRLPFNLEDRQSLHPAGVGYTNSPMGLLPGSYRLEAQVVPPLAQDFALTPGQQLTLDLPVVGSILVRRDKSGQGLAYQVLDLGGRYLGSGMAGRPLAAQPGRYLIVIPDGQKPRELTVKAGEVSALEPSPSASAH